jgi:glycosyltransferase involved in cell wall biosynthesis
VPAQHDSVQVTVALVTRDRKAELRRALESVMAQDAVAEIVLVDDGSTDGTAEMIRDEFPAVRFHRFEQPAGPAVSRNRATGLCTGDVVVYVDDDAYFPSAATVAQTLADFEDRRVAIVAIPFADVLGTTRIQRHHPPPDDEIWVTPTFVGAAYAARIHALNLVGGYRSEFEFSGEEADLSLRLLAEGYVTRQGRADPAVHEPSAVRSMDRMAVLGRRNEIVWVWSSFPAPWHVVYAVGYALKAIWWGLRLRQLRQMVRGALLGLRAIPSLERAPVPRTAFALDRRLRKHKALPLREIEADLAPLRRG